MAKLPKTNIGISHIRGNDGTRNGSGSLVTNVNAANLNYFDKSYTSRSALGTRPVSIGEFRNYGPGEGVPCGGFVEATGGVGNKNQEWLYQNFDVSLGSALGTVRFMFDPQTVPDRMIVTYNGSTVIDTGYASIGAINLDSYNQQIKQSFDSINSDGRYNVIRNRITSIVNRDLGFVFKKTSTVATANVKIYAPITNTIWQLGIVCPIQDQAYIDGRGSLTYNNFVTLSTINGQKMFVVKAGVTSRIPYSVIVYSEKNKNFTLLGQTNLFNSTTSAQFPAPSGAQIVHLGVIDKHGYNYIISQSVTV